MSESLEGGETGCWRVVEHNRDKRDCLGRNMCTEHLGPRMGTDQRKLELVVVGVHAEDLVARRRPKHLDDFDELVNTALARENGLAKHKFRQHTPSRPHIDAVCVLSGAKDELWCAIVARANVRNILFAGNKQLGTAEIAELDDTRCGIDEKILRLDITMAHANRVNVCQSTEGLVDEGLDVENWNWSASFGVLALVLIQRLRNKLQNQVQVHLVFLCAGGIEVILELDDVPMIEHAHDLKFAVLEARVLQNFLDGDGLSGGNKLGLEHQAERSVPNHLCINIAELTRGIVSAASMHHHGCDLGSLACLSHGHACWSLVVDVLGLVLLVNEGCCASAGAAVARRERALAGIHLRHALSALLSVRSLNSTACQDRMVLCVLVVEGCPDPARKRVLLEVLTCVDCACGRSVDCLTARLFVPSNRKIPAQIPQTSTNTPSQHQYLQSALIPPSSTNTPEPEQAQFLNATRRTGTLVASPSTLTRCVHSVGPREKCLTDCASCSSSPHFELCISFHDWILAVNSETFEASSRFRALRLSTS
eukprot:m.523355 g.523355  ORF g.523355 m.523355 type:complete len:537 (-) comp57523_c0_seq15:1321-2931(-)